MQSSNDTVALKSHASLLVEPALFVIGLVSLMALLSLL